MSIIKIRGRQDPVIRPYHIAKAIKQKKFGDDTVSPPVSKVLSTDLIDLGDEWSGTYGQILSIELNDKPQALQLQPEPEKPMTPEEKKRARDFFEEMRNKYPFLRGNKDAKKLTISRSGMAEYKRLTGNEYKVPEGMEIIEDLPQENKNG